jgi:NTE family protein
MNETDRAVVPTVAIACQGGGSHAAFAAGVLHALLQRECRDRYRLGALSGTSGGAMCAALAWSGLVAGDASVAAARLMAFWRDLEVHDLLDAAMNFWGLWFARLPVTAEISPYLYRPAAEPRLRALLRRHLDLESLPTGAHRRANPKLLIGATDIVSGLGVAFEGEQLTYDDLIASAAIPPVFRAVHAHGTLFWDGLFSRNPPIREFTDLPQRPDEIWVVQINPQRRTREPRAMPDIVDRRNELSGNLALGQELYFIAKVNELLAEHPSLGRRYKPIAIRAVGLDLELDYASKLDRSGALIERLLRHGEERAKWFFDDRSRWPREGTVPASSTVAKGRT